MKRLVYILLICTILFSACSPANTNQPIQEDENIVHEQDESCEQDEEVHQQGEPYEQNEEKSVDLNVDDEPIPFCMLLLGDWTSAHPGSPGRYTRDSYVFNENGVFAFQESWSRPTVRRRYAVGNWWIEDDNILHLSATHEIRIEGGEAQGEGWMAEIVGGQLVEREIPIAEREIIKHELRSLPCGGFHTLRVRMGYYTLWQEGLFDGHIMEMYRLINRHFPGSLQPNPYTREQWPEWFSAEMRIYAADFIHESWGYTTNVERLDLFYQNYRSGIADRILVQQEGNPAFKWFEIIYPGEGTAFTVQSIFSFLEEPDGIKIMNNISLIDNYYYFTQGYIRVENDIITFEKGGEIVQVEFSTFPFAWGQPMKIGREGSGFVHP